MLFNSLHFLIFFPVVTTLYFLLPHRYRWALLLAASCYFYMALIPAYILILFFLIGVDYIAGLLIENAAGVKRKLFLILSLVANIGVLGFFKYFNFLNDNIHHLAEALGFSWPVANLSIILPVGLSFHTFQSISYTIEVYRGRQRAERHLGIYALYVMFYPQLVAGPIERPQNLLHQFFDKHSFDYQRVTDGLKLMAWGLFKKVVIADRLAEAVNQVYDSPEGYSGAALLLATYYFAIQIYCDFSGYTDIALGAAQVMGFRLMENFRSPYHASSIAEFWKRWHISLSTWFRDYLYIPLGGNRISKPRWYFNLFFVFLVSGLWHGANWTFVIWGAFHGFYLIFSLWTQNIRQRLTSLLSLDRAPALHNLLRVFLTFNLVAFAWIFFRAPSLSQALYIVSHLFAFGSSPRPGVALEPLLLGRTDMIIALLAVLVMEAGHLMQKYSRVRDVLARQPALVRWTAYYAVVYATLFFWKTGYHQFIYFQF